VDRHEDCLISGLALPLRRVSLSCQGLSFCSVVHPAGNHIKKKLKKATEREFNEGNMEVIEYLHFGIIRYLAASGWYGGRL
jgi:hypothetical protein